MSEKEQVEAVKLLREWLARSKLATEPEISDLIDRTQRFLALEQPESHGQRRG